MGINRIADMWICCNNFLCRTFRQRVDADKIMLLLPRCIQNAECKENIVDDIMQCKQCGRCSIAEIRTRASKEGVRYICVATGTHMAREYIKRYNPRIVIAIACERELVLGILAVFPRSVYAIINSRPHGPCKNTHVDVGAVEKVMQMFKKVT